MFTSIIIGLILIVQVESDQVPAETVNGPQEKTVIELKALSDEKIKKPYQFGYEIEDGQGNLQHRHEESDGNGAKTGSYGYVDANGIYRKVEYIADKNGFRVKMSSNEPGVTGYNTPAISMITKPYTDDVTTPVSVSKLSPNLLGDDEDNILDPIVQPVVKSPPPPKVVKSNINNNRHSSRSQEDRLRHRHNSQAHDNRLYTPLRDIDHGQYESNRKHFPELQNDYQENHHKKKPVWKNKNSINDKKRKHDSISKEYEDAFNSFIDRPPAPPTPPRPPTPTRLFSTPKSSHGKVNSESGRKYTSTAAADWSPRHHEPPPQPPARENAVKSNSQSNRVNNNDKPHRHVLENEADHFESKHRASPSSPPTPKQRLMPPELPKIVVGRHDLASEYNEASRLDETLRNQKPDVIEGHRYYYHTKAPRIHYPVDNHHKPKKSSQLKKMSDWTSDEEEHRTSRQSSTLRPKFDSNWRVVDDYSDNKYMTQRPKKPIKLTKHQKTDLPPVEPNHYNKRPEVTHENHNYKSRNHKAPSPPSEPKVHYDVPEFPLPVLRSKPTSSPEPSESGETKPLSNEDLSALNENDGKTVKQPNQVKHLYRNSDFDNSRENTIGHQEKTRPSEFNGRHLGAEYLTQSQNKLQKPADRYHHYSPQTQKQLPSSPSPSAYPTQASSSAARHQKQPYTTPKSSSESPNNQHKQSTTTAKKRPAAYPPAPQTYQPPMNQVTPSSDGHQPNTITSDLTPRVFYYDNSGSSESSSSSSSHEANQPKHYRDYYSYEADQHPQLTNGPHGPIMIKQIELPGISADMQQKSALRMNPSQISPQRQIILTPREDSSPSVSSENSRSLETVASSSSAEAYATFKNGLKELVPLIQRNSADPYKPSDLSHPLIMEPSQRDFTVAGPDTEFPSVFPMTSSSVINPFNFPL